MTEAAGTRRSPTMYDVATAAGVSHQTVSRVLNGADSIRPTTRDRVLAAIEELGYRRNLAARTLATNRSRAIGVLAPAVDEFGPTRTVEAIEAAARRAGYQPLVTTASADRESIATSLGFLLDQAVEALVVLAPQPRILEAMSELDIAIPVVTLQDTGVGGGTAVYVDQHRGAWLAAEHLLSLGHRRLQQLAGPAEYFEAIARRHGFADALAAAGLTTSEPLVGDWTAESGFTAASAVANETTAVFCGNDQMALGLIAGLAEQGRHVPEDVSIVGFDDLPESRFFRPALTTLSQDFLAVGRLAVEVITGEIETGERREVPPIVPTLIVRGSTAAV